MPELSNRDIDDIFQRGAERYDFEYKEEAWQEMESLLERDRRRRLLWWWIAGILLALLLAFITYQLVFAPSQHQGPAPDRQEKAPVAGTKKKDLKGAQHSENSGKKEAASTYREDISPSFRKDTTLTIEASVPQAQQLETAPADNTLLPSHPIAENNSTSKQPDNAPDQMAQKSALPPTEKLPTTGPSAEQLTDAQPPFTTPFPLEVLPPIRMEALAPEFAVLPSPKQKPIPTDTGDSSPPDVFVLGAGFSPESASIGTDDFGEVDFKAGVHLEYRFATHFSIGSGIHYTRKHYQAGRGEYTPEEDFWTRQITPDKSYGYCSMLEVPINITYFLHRHDRNSLFLEAGLTNFIMLNEHYWYSYYDQPDPDLIRYWASNFEYHTWMGILNISPGYQMRLSKRFGVQAAPFIQIPLTGVGHGNVDLYSLGLNLRLYFRTKI